MTIHKIDENRSVLVFQLAKDTVLGSPGWFWQVLEETYPREAWATIVGPFNSANDALQDAQNDW